MDHKITESEITQYLKNNYKDLRKCLELANEEEAKHNLAEIRNYIKLYAHPERSVISDAKAYAEVYSTSGKQEGWEAGKLLGAVGSGFAGYVAFLLMYSENIDGFQRKHENTVDYATTMTLYTALPALVLTYPSAYLGSKVGSVTGYLTGGTLGLFQKYNEQLTHVQIDKLSRLDKFAEEHLSSMQQNRLKIK